MSASKQESRSWGGSEAGEKISCQEENRNLCFQLEVISMQSSGLELVTGKINDSVQVEEGAQHHPQQLLLTKSIMQ